MLDIKNTDIGICYGCDLGNMLLYASKFSKKIIDDINFKFDKNFKKFKFSLSDCIYSVQSFESIIAFKIDRSKCDFSKLLENKGKDHGPAPAAEE